MWMQACLKEAELKKAEEAADSSGMHLTPEQKLLVGMGIDVSSTDDDIPAETDMDDELPPPPPEDPAEDEEEEEELLPPASELEEALRNGVILVRLANWFAPEAVSHRHMYDVDEKVYRERGLVFRHTDNVNQWLKAMAKKKFPKVFYPEVTDIYDKKNMPKAIYCIHALSRYLFSLGIGPLMEDLTGKASFTEEEISAMDAALADAGIQMPQFGKIGGMLAAEIGEDAAAHHAAILAINKGVEMQVETQQLLQLLMALHAKIEDLDTDMDAADRYRDLLTVAFTTKNAEAAARAEEADESSDDVYDTNLTQAEIQKQINLANAAIGAERKQAALEQCIGDVVNAATVGDAEALWAALTAETLGISEADEENAAEYLAALAAKVADGTQLTVGVIQDAVDDVNAAVAARKAEEARLASKAYAIEQINTAVANADPDAIIAALQAEAAGIAEVDAACGMEYLVQLSEANKAVDGPLDQAQIQAAVSEANVLVDEQRRLEAALAAINNLLYGEDGDCAATYALMTEHRELLELPELWDAAERYYTPLCNLAKERGALTLRNLIDTVIKVNEELAAEKAFTEAVAAVNDAARGDDAAATFAALHHVALAVADVRERVQSDHFVCECPQRYHSTLAAKCVEGDVSRDEIAAAVADVNAQADSELAFANALGVTSVAIAASDVAATIAALMQPVLDLKDVDEAGAEQYLAALKESLDQSSDPTLSVEELQECVTHTNTLAEEAAKEAASLFRVNEAVTRNDAGNTFTALFESYAKIDNVQEKCTERYHPALKAALTTKAGGNVAYEWKSVSMDDGKVYYYNRGTKETQWVVPAGPEIEQKSLSIDEIKAVVAQCNDDQARAEFLEANQDKIVLAQAAVRGHQARKAYLDRKAYIESQAPHILRIQSLVRMILQRKRFRERLAFLNAQTDAAVTLQAAWKGVKVRRNYKGLTERRDPPVGTVRRFLHLLDQTDTDFNEELQVGDLKQSVVRDIKRNQQLETEVNAMDTKIELLIKNRIALMDVVRQAKVLQKSRKKGARGADVSHHSHGLKAMDAASRQRLVSYQHLFYLLQTNPKYLATLVFIEKPLDSWSHVKATRFLERIIETTYNYGSSSREKFLLLRLYREAMRREVKDRIDAVEQFTKESPAVVRLFMNHYKGQGSDHFFEKCLRAPMIDLLNQQDVDMETEPVKVYKRWVNHQEAETGEKSELPFEVDAQQAMEHPEVQEAVARGASKVVSWAAKFLSAITRAVKYLPFGLRYLCMDLEKELQSKFPEDSKKDIDRVLCNLLYFRCISPVIIAPEGFHVVDDILRDHPMSESHRMNLASVARVLQFAASGQFFEERAEFAELNIFLKDANIQFTTFFEEAIRVVSAEQHFGINEFSDVTMVSHPSIFITPREVHNTHHLFLANMDKVAPSEDDPLRVVLADLGGLPDEADVLADDEHADGEMSLVLTNRFEIPEEEDTSLKALLIRTKRRVIDVIRFQEGSNLKAILDKPATKEMEAQHMDHMATMKEKADLMAKKAAAMQADDGRPGSPTRRMSQVDESMQSLEEIKSTIRHDLPELVQAGVCNEEDGFQGILNSIAEDIRNQRVHRRQRKEELRKLQGAVTELEKKSEYFESQISFYQQYVDKAIEQNAKGKGLKRGGMFSKKHNTDESGRHVGSYKYSALKLKEKGVIVDTDVEESISLKNITIEVKSEGVGEFSFKAMMLKIPLDKETLNFQELLEMQYNNVQTTKICGGRVTVNINLLIFLLNKKFNVK